MSFTRRIVVTGMGIVSPIGIEIPTFWKNLVAGRSGIGDVTQFDSARYRTHKAGEVKDFDPAAFTDTPEKISRTAQFALSAAKQGARDCNFPAAGYDPLDVAVVMGAVAADPLILRQIGPACSTRRDEKQRAYLAAKAAINTPVVVICREFGIRGIANTVSTACSAGNYAIAQGYDLIKDEKARAVFCGGVDAFSQVIYAGFNRLFVVAPDKCRPFDRNRQGMIISEGAGMIILEDMESALDRNAKIYAEVLGYGISCGAQNMVNPTKSGMKHAIKKAISNSGMQKKDVDYISAHGTATLNNDRTEAMAIREVFGRDTDNIYVSSIKSMLGHALSAASILEAISCCLSICKGVIPPTINYETPDPECRLNIVANRAVKTKINVVLNNSFAFGGNNACVVFGKYLKIRPAKAGKTLTQAKRRRRKT